MQTTFFAFGQKLGRSCINNLVRDSNKPIEIYGGVKKIKRRIDINLRKSDAKVRTIKYYRYIRL